MAEEGSEGQLYIVGTPIGNLGDISQRAIDSLQQASVIAAEDTRRTRTLLSHLNISKPLISCHGHNEEHRSKNILERLERGEQVVLVSDAGMPGISDPGMLVVKEALRSGFSVVPIPGPCAFLTALCASGLSTERFTFIGFLPHKIGKKKKALQQNARETGTLIFYEAPTRVLALLQAIEEVLGARQVVLARELTKKFETFERGIPSDLIAYYEGEGASTLRGEFTVLVEGASRDSPIVAEVDGPALESARGIKDLSVHVARVLGINKKEAYQALLKLKP